MFVYKEDFKEVEPKRKQTYLACFHEANWVLKVENMFFEQRRRRFDKAIVL